MNFKEMLGKSFSVLLLDMSKFYLAGIICYSIISFFNSVVLVQGIRFALEQNDLSIPLVISGVFRNIFDYCILSFFLFLYKMTKQTQLPQEKILKVQDDSLDDELLKYME